MWCSACGDKLGDPEEDLHDPKGEFLSDMGVIENPDDHHIKVVYGEKGMRLQCSNTGQMTKLEDNPPNEGSPEGDASGGGGPKQKAQEQGGSTTPGGVYELKEDKDAEDVLLEVIKNDAYELKDDQISEVMSWAGIYDGKIPADMLEDILGNLSGVSNQQASLMRQKYEALMNKWLQEATSDTGGPPIGSFTPPHSPSGQGGPRRPQQNPQPGQQPQPQSKPQQPSQTPDKPEQNERPQRRPPTGKKRRERRRQEVADEVAQEMARNMASDAGRFYSDLRNLASTVLQRKAEKDPDWFLEKADEFGMDLINELSEPSEAKRNQEEQGQAQPQTDAEVDQALQEMMGDQSGGGQPQPQEPPQQPQQNQPRQPPSQPPREQQSVDDGQPTESNKPPQQPTETNDPMEPSQDQQEEQSDEDTDPFEEIMGDVTE